MNEEKKSLGRGDSHREMMQSCVNPRRGIALVFRRENARCDRFWAV